jgi:hypothetical protein
MANRTPDGHGFLKKGRRQNEETDRSGARANAKTPRRNQKKFNHEIAKHTRYFNRQDAKSAGSHQPRMDTNKMENIEHPTPNNEHRMKSGKRKSLTTDGHGFRKKAEGGRRKAMGEARPLIMQRQSKSDRLRRNPAGRRI